MMNNLNNVSPNANSFMQQLAAVMHSAFQNKTQTVTNEPTYDRDTLRTGIKKFEIGSDIYRFAMDFEDHVAPKFPEDAKKHEAFLERLSFDARTKLLGQSDVQMLTYSQLRVCACKALGGSDSVDRKLIEFQMIRKQTSERMEDFTSRVASAWATYNFCRAVNDLSEEDDKVFIEKFLTLLPTDIQPLLNLQLKMSNVETIQHLQTYMHSYGSVFDPKRAHTMQNNIEQQLKKEIDTLKKQLIQQNRQQQAIGSSTFALTNVQADTHKLDQEIQAKLNNTQSNALKDVKEENKQMKTLLNNIQTQLQAQAAETQRAKSELQQQQRALSHLHQISQNRDFDYRQDYRHRDRSRSPSRDYRSPSRDNYRNQNNTNHRARNPYNNDYNNTSYRSRSSSPHRERSRSPSPTPQNNKCFACGEQHWMIECPHLTREEKETELFKIIKRKERQDGTHMSKENETALRNKYNIPYTKPNKSRTHDENKPVTGKGHFCKWCHTRGHSMFICPWYCPICEEDGHGWENCTKNIPFVTQRKDKFANFLKRLRIYSNSN